MSLTRDQILETALEIIDEGGLDAFTLRELGRRLGVSQMAAYRHFPDKATIIDALADRIMSSVRIDDSGRFATAEERILDYPRRARAALLEHPALISVIASRPLVRPVMADDLIELYLVFNEAGFPDDAIVEAILSLMSITLGLLLYEQHRMTFNRSQGHSYHEDRMRALGELQARPDAPAVSADILQTNIDGQRSALLFDQTIRDCWHGIRRRAGLPEAS